MNTKIELIRKARLFLLEGLKELSTEQLNKIPEGFSNNIAWNLGHTVWAQQGICYLRSGLKPAIDEPYIMPYKMGTRPEQFISEEEIERIKQHLISSMDMLQTDYDSNLFANYTTWTNRFGAEFTNIDQAIEFVSYHEGLHAGYILSLRKFV